MQTPFNFGRTVKSDCFTNRETEVKKLASNFENRINTILLSPRRWGKSSLVEKVASQVRSKNIKVIIIDLFGIRTEEDFYNTLATKVIKATSGKTDEWIELGKKFLKGLTPKFTLDLGESTSFSMQLDLDAIKKYYRDLLDFPEKIAKEKNIDIVICIDEFQNISTFNDPMGVQKRLRSVWQNHERVTYCLYGSKQHMMSDLFTKQSNPFYKFGELMYLPKIDEIKWVSFITRQFEKTKKEISKEYALRIAHTVKCHPYYVQHLSHLTWANTPKKANDTIIRESIQELIDQNAILYFKETEDLNNTEINLLKAIARGEEQLSSKDTINKYKLGTSAGVLKAKNTLALKEIIDVTGKKASFLDPVYELWFLQNIPLIT